MMIYLIKGSSRKWMKALRASNSFYAVRSLLTSTIYERGRLRGYSQALPGETEPLLRCGLDADAGSIQTHGCGDVTAHGGDVRRQLRRLRDDRGIHVPWFKARLTQDTAHLPQKGQAVCALITRVAVREMPAYVAQCRRPQQGIHDGVDQNVRIRVSQQTLFIGYLHSAEYQLPALHEPVAVDPDTGDYLGCAGAVVTVTVLE